MTSPGKRLVRLSIVLLLVGSVTTNCTWLRNMRKTPRKHWWEIWKPKTPDTDFYYPDIPDPVPPAPPPVIDPNAGGVNDTLPDIAPPEPAVGVEPNPLDEIPATKTRADPRGMLNELQTVYFDYDSSVLKPEAVRILDENAEYLRQHPEIKVLIEGHCDERGTQEYNLNLGQRRADAVRQYLISKDVPGGQLETISFGEERPADPGTGEAAWALNRRAQFMIY